MVCTQPSFEGRWRGTACQFRDGRFFVAKQHFHRKVKPLFKLHRRCNPKIYITILLRHRTFGSILKYVLPLAKSSLRDEEPSTNTTLCFVSVPLPSKEGKTTN